ncbi:hypothetical protein NQZ79_g8726 [Umbelopsis isabellina]|nr:hypothetical protein NQZ79_g8726 [Umbelopsis isabellina]
MFSSKKLLVILLLTLSALVLLTASKKVDTDDITTWDKAQLKAWLTEHKINYDSSSDLSSLVKQYRDSATHYAGLFGVKVDQATDKLRNSLTSKKEITDANIDYIVDEVKRQLRTLELEGQLDYQHIQGGLSKAKKDVLKKKAATEEQWSNIAADVEADFLTTKKTWYQQFFSNKNNAADSAKAWLDETRSNLEKQKDLSEKQINEIIDSMRSRIESVDDWRKETAKKDKEWFKQLTKDMETKADLTKEQAEQTITNIENDFAGFKASAIEYANGAYDSGQAYLSPFVDRVSTSLRESGDLTQAKVNEIIAAIKARFGNVNWKTMQAQQQKTYLEQFRDDISEQSKQTKDQVNHIVGIVQTSLEEYLASIKSYLSPNASQASKSASSVYGAATSNVGAAQSSAASATDSVKSAAASATNDAQKNVQKWLRSNERSLFEKKGYAQAHIDWIENYLVDSFNNAKDITTQEVNDAANAVQSYLERATDVTKDQARSTAEQIRNGLQHARDEL